MNAAVSEKDIKLLKVIEDHEGKSWLFYVQPQTFHYNTIAATLEDRGPFIAVKFHVIFSGDLARTPVKDEIRTLDDTEFSDIHKSWQDSAEQQEMWDEAEKLVMPPSVRVVPLPERPTKELKVVFD